MVKQRVFMHQVFYNIALGYATRRVLENYGRLPINNRNNLNGLFGKGTGKVLPRTGYEDPEGEQRYSSLFL
jgi:hypothetical protein